VQGNRLFTNATATSSYPKRNRWRFGPVRHGFCYTYCFKCDTLLQLLQAVNPARSVATTPNNKPIRNVVCAGAHGRLKPIPRSCANSQCALEHCSRPHDMSIRPILVEVGLTNVFRSDRSRKPRCRNGLLQTQSIVGLYIWRSRCQWPCGPAAACGARWSSLAPAFLPDSIRDLLIQTVLQHGSSNAIT